MANENIKQIIGTLKKEKRNIQQQIKIERDTSGYFTEQINKIDKRIELYKNRLKLRKNYN